MEELEARMRRLEAMVATLESEWDGWRKEMNGRIHALGVGRVPEHSTPQTKEQFADWLEAQGLPQTYPTPEFTPYWRRLTEAETDPVQVQVGMHSFWEGRTLLIRRDEIDGLDRQGFRELLRVKLNELYEEFLSAWEVVNGQNALDAEPTESKEVPGER